MKFIFILLVLMGLCSVCNASVYAVLTNNAADDEPGLHTSAAYTAEPAFDNPTDPNNTKLTDSDLPSDWTTTAGINFKDQTVTFDLKKNYITGKVQLLFDMDAKPASVDVKVSQDNINWIKAGSVIPESRIGWYELTFAKPQSARYVKLDFKLGDWGWYLREVKIWGRHGDEILPKSGYIAKSNKPGTLITEDGVPVASIVVAENAKPKALKAAFELQDYIYSVSGARLAIRSEAETTKGTMILVGPGKNTRAMGISTPSGYPNAERVLVKTDKNRIALLGNDDGVYSGTQFAVRMLLSKIDCGWFGPEPLWQPINKSRTVVVPKLNLSQKPDFELRNLWIGLGEKWMLGGPPLNCGHAHDVHFPPSQYFAEHPEYYALINGKRTAEGEWQLCTSNADVRRLLVEKARKFFDDNPNQVMFSLSNNDCGGFCECEECKKTGANASARMLDVCNYVARELRKTHRDKWIIFFAYWYTHDAPADNIKAEPGVCVMVINQGCHAHAITDNACQNNVAWKANFEKWCNTGAKMAIYEWYIPGCNNKYWQRLPWVSGETALKNLRYWKSRNVQWITYETQHAYEEKAYSLRWPLFYTASIGMWDTSQSADQIMADACKKLYGSAHREMFNYYKTLERAMNDCKLHSVNWGMPDANGIYTETVRNEARKYLDAALNRSANVPGLQLDRIKQESEVWALAEKTLDEMKSAPKPEAK